MKFRDFIGELTAALKEHPQFKHVFAGGEHPGLQYGAARSELPGVYRLDFKPKTSAATLEKVAELAREHAAQKGFALHEQVGERESIGVKVIESSVYLAHRPAVEQRALPKPRKRVGEAA